MIKRIVLALALFMLIFSFAVNGTAKEEEEDRYSMTFSLNGNDMPLAFTFLNDSSAVMTLSGDFACGYERTGRAVHLFLQEEAENDRASLWDQAPHDYLLDQEGHTLTAIRGAYMADLFVFYFLDESRMLIEYVNSNEVWPGFTYHTDGEYLYVSAPSAEELGEFNHQTWESVGREKWPVEAKSVIQGDIAWAEPILQDKDAMWKKDIYRIACQYNPEMRSGEVIFYGASNFNYWRTMEEDLQPYAVQNHAFGGSTDRDLLHWAQYMLYPYQPKIIFFQTGSNDYVKSNAKTEQAKVAEAMKFKKAMFEKLQKKMPETKMVIMSGILLPGRKEYVNMTLDINDQLKALAEETDYLWYVDAEALTYIRGEGFVENVEDLFISDAIHLKPEARLVWAEKWILPMLEELGADVCEPAL